MELDDGHDDGDGLNEDQVLQLGKEERENKMSDRAILFCHSRHHKGCEWI
jgi:hypothetical protein